jgi:hypothetical protein
MDKISPEQFRLKLASLVDDSKKSEIIQQSLLDEAVDFVSELPRFFSEDFDRMTLWERIGNGLLAASAKADNNCDLFINSILSYIKASHSSVAASDRLAAFVAMFNTRDDVWKRDFIRQFQTYHYLIIIKSRTAWNDKKKKGISHA